MLPNPRSTRIVAVCRVAILVACPVTGACSGVSRVTSQAPQPSAATCYRVDETNWHYKSGAAVPEWRRPGVVVGYIKLLAGSAPSPGFTWMDRPDGKLVMSTNTVMVGWTIDAQRTVNGFTGTLHYVNDTYTEDLIADIAGTGLPCDQVPASSEYRRAVVGTNRVDR